MGLRNHGIKLPGIHVAFRRTLDAYRVVVQCECKQCRIDLLQRKKMREIIGIDTDDAPSS